MDDQLTLYCVIDINHDGRLYAAGSPFPLVSGPDVDKLREAGFLKLASEMGEPTLSSFEQQHNDLVAAHRRIAELEAQLAALRAEGA